MSKPYLLIVLILCMALEVMAARPVYAESSDTEPSSATGIVEKYIQASGGHALRDVATESGVGTLQRGRTGKIPFEIISKSPGKWRWHQTFAWGDGVCYGFDGVSAWVQDTKSVVAMDPQQRLNLQLMLDPQAPLKLCEWFPRMEIRETETLGEKETVLVLASTAEGWETELAFDCETGLLLRAGNVRFEDYREAGSVKRPFRIILGEDQGEEHLRMIMEFSETKHNVDIDDSIFQTPVSALPLVEAHFTNSGHVPTPPSMPWKPAWGDTSTRTTRTLPTTSHFSRTT